MGCHVVEELPESSNGVSAVTEERNWYVGAGGGASVPPMAIPATLPGLADGAAGSLGHGQRDGPTGSIMGENNDELLHAVSPYDKPRTLQHGLQQIVEAELIYQRGLPPQARYVFERA